MQVNLQYYKFVVQFSYVNDFVQNIPSAYFPFSFGQWKTLYSGVVLPQSWLMFLDANENLAKIL